MPGNAHWKPSASPVLGSVASKQEEPGSSGPPSPRAVKSLMVAEPGPDAPVAGCMPGHPPGAIACDNAPAPQSAMVRFTAECAAEELKVRADPTWLMSTPSSP